MSRWLDVVFRIVALILGGAGLLGFVWFIDSVPPTSFAVPLVLLALGVLPLNWVGRHPWLVLLGVFLCVVDITIRGFPFMRTYEALDVEIFSTIQLGLIAYFIVRVLRSTSKF